MDRYPPPPPAGAGRFPPPPPPVVPRSSPPHAGQFPPPPAVLDRFSPAPAPVTTSPTSLGGSSGLTSPTGLGGRSGLTSPTGLGGRSGPVSPTSPLTSPTSATSAMARTSPQPPGSGTSPPGGTAVPPPLFRLPKRTPVRPTRLSRHTETAELTIHRAAVVFGDAAQPRRTRAERRRGALRCCSRRSRRLTAAPLPRGRCRSSPASRRYCGSPTRPTRPARPAGSRARAVCAGTTATSVYGAGTG